PEHAAQEIGQIEIHLGGACLRAVSASRPAETAKAAAPETATAEAVEHFLLFIVFLAFLGIRQHSIRFGYFFEPVFGLFIVGVRVGVVVAREFAVRLFYLALRCVLGDAKDLVKVFGRPVCATHSRHLPSSLRWCISLLAR